MFAKIVLCATDNKLTAGIWRFGKLQSYQVFQDDELGHEDFTRFLQRNSNTTIYLLADAVEEDFRLETLPHSTGRARHEMVERKLNQIYRGTMFRAAHFINRAQDHRKDDRFLFIALNTTDFLQAWIHIIEAQQAPLAGVYLLPMISQVLVRRMKLMAPHILLSERLSSGLRQTYLHNGRLRISRSAPIPPTAQNQLGYFYLVETEKTRLYLISQRFITRDTPLSMVLPALDDSSNQICRGIEQEQGLDCSSVDLNAFAKGLSLQPQLLQAHPELLHMQLLAMGNVPDNLAPHNLTKHFRLDFVRRWINIATVASVLSGLTMAGVYLKDSFDQAALVEQAVKDTRMQERLYNEVAKNFPSTPIPSTDLKAAVELQHSISNYAKPPRSMMQSLSQALDATPEVQINRLRWVLTNDTNLKDDDKTSAASVAIQSTAAPGQPALVPDAAGLYEIGFIDGEIKGFTGDYRAALESVNRLVERLRRNNAVEQVVVLQEPVNVSSYSSLQGSTTDERSAQLPAAQFKLKLILKREAPPA